MKYLLTVGMLAGLSVPAAAQDTCFPSRALVAELLTSSKYNEQAIAQGITNDYGYRMDLWVNADSKSWSITMTRQDGVTCVMATGKDFSTIPVAIKGQGL